MIISSLYIMFECKFSILLMKLYLCVV